LTDGPAAPA